MLSNPNYDDILLCGLKTKHREDYIRKETDCGISLKDAEKRADYFLNSQEGVEYFSMN
jgi:hypothetical protein